MMNGKNNKSGIRLASIMMIWLLVGGSFISFFSPIAGTSNEEINSKTHNSDKMDTSQTNSRAVGVRSLANSPWPKFRGDIRNTGLSKYDTSKNGGKEIWKFGTGDIVFSSPVIDSDGTIYVGSGDKFLYAIKSDGTLKWKLDMGYQIHSSPVISSDGMIYLNNGGNFFAINSNGTIKWKIGGGTDSSSSPTIGPDGMIYYCSYEYLNALYPNSTLKWSYKIGSVYKSSPAIDSDGVIYTGSHDYFYAIYPNGTLKWKFNQGNDQIYSSPAIGSDGTIYFGPAHDYTVALYPNGTEKWRLSAQIGHSSAAIAPNGTIYISGYNHFYAVHPNGTIKWKLDIEGGDSSPAIGSDGTVYFGADDNYLYAMNPDGTQRWRFQTGKVIESSPAIGSDGTIYIGSNDYYLYALKGIYIKPNRAPVAEAGPDQNVSVSQTVFFNGSGSYDPDDDLSYNWDFGDGTSTGWQNSSKTSHSYSQVGNYTVTLTVSDGSLQDNDTCIVNVKSIKGAPLANSPWPMFMNNLKHTGLSKYNTINNTGDFIWKRYIRWGYGSSPVIDSKGIIYAGGGENDLYAIYPNGTLKWKFGKTYSSISTSPALANDGTIYVAISDNFLYSIYPNGTLKWKFDNGDGFLSSPAIGDDGTIYVGGSDDYLYAIYPDGSLRWKFKTGDCIYSTPAISDNGTIYFGSYDKYFYAINPDGTLKWKFDPNNGVYSSPSIGSDGTIYFGTVSSYNNPTYLFALNPNGTLKWKFEIESVFYCAPAIGPDGTIYIGPDHDYFYAVNPNGTLKWKVDIYIGWSSPAISAEGTIYIGSYENYLFSLNPDGTENWKFKINGIVYSPAIGSDGTIYVGNWDNNSKDGYIYAIGKNDTSINQPPIANAGSDQNTTVNQTVYYDGSGSYDPDNDLLKHKWDFGDGTSTGWQNNSNSSHFYSTPGNYTSTLYVDDGELTDFDTCLILVNGSGWSDPTPTSDSDEDGVPDYLDPNPFNNIDTDNDGLSDDYETIFSGTDPNNYDTDSDGVDDKNDYFPLDPTRYLEPGVDDSDNDGIGDNKDAFPNDPAASIDTDMDGYPDEWNLGKLKVDSITGLQLDAFPNDSTEWTDTDGDGVGDNSDAYPNDPSRYKKETTQDYLFEIILITLVIIILIIIISLKLFIQRSKRQRLSKTDFDEEMLNTVRHKILHGETLQEMEYSRDEIEGMLDRKFKAGKISIHTHNLIKKEILCSDEAQFGQINNSKLRGKE